MFAPVKDSGIIAGQRPGPHAGTALGLRLSVVTGSPVVKGAAQWLGVPVVAAADREPVPLPEPETNPWPHPGDVSVRRKPVGEATDGQRGAATWAGRELGPVPAAKRQAEAVRLHGDLFRSLANSTRVALETADVVVVHTSVVDAVSARRRRGAKRLAVEQLDEGLLGPLMKMLRERYDRPATGFGGGGFRIAVVASSVNDSMSGRHADVPAPLAMWGTDVEGRVSLTLTEDNAGRAGFEVADASGLLTWIVRGL
jgi:2,3-bisphosphoglycerate-independent phosphoglycerate mutase